MENREIVLSSVLLESPAHLRPVGTSHPTPLQPTQEPQRGAAPHGAQHRTGRASGLLYPCLPTAARLDGAACLLRCLSKEPKQGERRHGYDLPRLPRRHHRGHWLRQVAVTQSNHFK